MISQVDDVHKCHSKTSREANCIAVRGLKEYNPSVGSALEVHVESAGIGGVSTAFLSSSLLFYIHFIVKC